jgi:hypothetical protein
MGAFGQVIPVIGTLNGFLGEVSRTGGGDPFISTRLANVANAANINFGDVVVLLPDTAGGTVKQYADWVANPAGFAITAATASSTTVTPVAAAMAQMSVGMAISGPGIPAGTFITAVGATTITISKAATTTNGAAALFVSFVYGIAVREVKTMLTYNPTAGGTSGSLIGSYTPGSYVGVLLRGSIVVACNVGTPFAGGQAFLRSIFNGGIPAGVVGGLEANIDGTNTQALNAVNGVADAYWKNGAIDANKLSELTFLSRMAP